MISRILVAVLLPGVVLTAPCRPLPQPAPKQQLSQVIQVPDYILWDAFFFRVNWLNNLADGLDAKGQSGDWARAQIARQAHLTSQQQQALDAIAADYRTTNDAIVAQIVALAPGGASSANAQQVSDLQDQRKQNVLDHIAQLQAAFGNNIRFQALAGYVRGTTKVKAFAAPPTAQAPQAGKEPL